MGSGASNVIHTAKWEDYCVKGLTNNLTASW